MKQWAEAQNLNLIHDANLPKSFNSGRWKRGYNPDLVFVISNIATLVNKLVLEPIPRTQHRPIGININATVVPKTVPSQRRFNFTEANWQAFLDEQDDLIEDLETSPMNYEKVIELVHMAARNKSLEVAKHLLSKFNKRKCQALSREATVFRGRPL